jgi:two-component system response regulator AtoC
MPQTLLIIEDEALLGQELLRHFRREGWDVRLASGLDEARRLLLTRDFEPLVVLSDMNLPEGNALDLLEEVRAARLSGEWIILTGYGGVPDSVRAVKLGAYDFLEKPVAARAARPGPVRRPARRPRANPPGRPDRRGMQALRPGRFSRRQRAGMREVREMLARLAQVPFSALLIGGETGTGKGLAARILHYAGPRRDGPLVEINCAALPRELVEGELFGAEAQAHSPAPKGGAAACWNRPPAARCSSTSWASCRSTRRQSCSRPSRTSACAGSAASARSAWMCRSSPPAIVI